MKINKTKIEKIEKDFYSDKKDWDLFLTKHFVNRVKERIDPYFEIDNKEFLRENIKNEMKKYFVNHPFEMGYDENFKSTRIELFGHFVRIFFHLELAPSKIWNVIVTTITRKEKKGDKRIRRNMKSKRKWRRKRDINF